ncbi:putative cyclin-B3-1 isoform B [Glycine soja]|uniref:B-like cyclin n=1 Tax=Glycine soja TaxID=3848 RepID=A0A445JJ59_GLYSO|nr:putative cyclin-B3-1 isoform B [Glycine soja]
MVSLTGKSRVGSTRASVGGGQSRPSVGGRNFKVFSEIDRTKVGDGNMTYARGAGASATARSTVVANKRVILNSTSSPKGGLKKSMDKSSGKYGTSGSTNVRKALADVSNAQEKFTTAVVANKGVILNSTTNPKGGLKKSMDRSSGKYGTSGPGNTNVRKTLADVSNVQENFTTAVGIASSKMKVPAGSSSKIAGVSLRKSFTGRVQRYTRKSVVQLDALNRDDQKNNTNGGQSVNATKDRFTRKPIATSSSRKSLPVLRRVSREDTSNTKENVRSSQTAKGQSGLPTKATTNRRDSSQLINSRSHLWKYRVSDGFVQMVQPNVLHASSRKSTKPIVKTTIKAVTAQRTLKSKSRLSQNKLESTTATSSQNKSLSAQKNLESTTVTSSQDKESVSLSLPEKSLTVSDDTNQSCLPSGESNLTTNLLELIPRKKSFRRKSYTTSLIEGSKPLILQILKESGDVREQDNLPNIDNECNQLEVSEYIDDIYLYYWVTEAHNPLLANYMSIQTDISPPLRGILINWLIEVHFKFDLMPETLYLTVTLLDQYLSLVTIKKTDMQLVGLTALLLASKYEDFWHPRVKDLISISAESYTRDQMLGMEKLILRKLKFRLNAPTPYVFMVRFLKAAQSDKKLEHMAFFLVDLCLVEYEALAFKPSLLCASALYVARCTLQITPPWTPLLHKHARYEVSQIRDCADMILKFHKAAGVGKLKVIYEKYSRQELSRVAAVKPLDKLPWTPTTSQTSTL